MCIRDSMKPNLFHTQFFRLFFLILLAGISIQTYAAKDSQAAPKKRTITGKVISEGDNIPIIGANVWLKNSSTGAITDLDGKYSCLLYTSRKTSHFVCYILLQIH